MNIFLLNEKIERKRKHLVNTILNKSMELTNKDIIQISKELDELIALYIELTEKDRKKKA